MGIFGKVKQGLIVIVSAPAGTGKTTLIDMLLKEYPQEVARSISCTTRAPRGTEQQGVDYIFLSQEAFKKKVAAGEFLEYARVFEHYYGTLRETVISIQAQGKHVVLVIDTQGALYLKDKIDAVFVFIAPPSIEVLRKRMEHRNTETKESIDLRLSHAQEEMAKAKYYDCVILNQDLQQAYQNLKTFIGKTEQERCQYVH